MALALAVLAHSIDSVSSAGAANRAGARTSNAAASVEATILSMSTGVPAYLSTGQPAFLTLWHEGRAALPGELARLSALGMRGQASDRGLIAKIAQTGRRYIASYAQLIARKAERPASVAGTAAVASAADAANRRSRALQALFTNLRTVNNADAQSRLARAIAANHRARARASWLVVAALLLLVAWCVQLVRWVVWPIRRAAKAADAAAGGDNSVRVPETGPREVRELGRSLNKMATAIDASSSELKARNRQLDEQRTAAQQVAGELSAQQSQAIDLISTIGFDGMLKSVNPAFERTLGFTEAEMLSRPFMDYVHPDDLERTAAEAAKLAAGIDTVKFENRWRTKAGEYRWLEWHVRPDVEHELLYSVTRDTTGRKESEQALAAAREEADQANLAKSEFLSRMSHELRTPLNAILGFGQLLEMDELEPAQSESVAQILGGGHYLLSLIDEVLDISRIETGSMRVSLEPVEVMSALGDAVALVTPVAEQAGITLDTQLLSDAECHVLADRQRLRQVVLNLLSNAVKYSRPGDKVTVSYASIADRVKITVADTGAGIDPAKLDRLFVAFDRLDAEESGVQGTGLGLALSRSLVELMGGTIEAHSFPGQGSAFTVELTAAPSPVSLASLANARHAGTLATVLGTRTILYIEDNPSNARLVQHTFSGQPDVKLIQAIQGSTGLELARAHRPDLILLDLHLPDMHGSDVLDRLQADPATADIPVVILSADATERQVRALRAAGARAYLTKPLDISEFLAVVSAELSVEVSA